MDQIEASMEGKWIVVHKDTSEIVESGDDIKKILESAQKKYPLRKLSLTQVFRKGSFIY
jgi:hypothetical protein